MNRPINVVRRRIDRVDLQLLRVREIYDIMSRCPPARFCRRSAGCTPPSQVAAKIDVQFFLQFFVQTDLRQNADPFSLRPRSLAPSLDQNPSQLSGEIRILVFDLLWFHISGLRSKLKVNSSVVDDATRGMPSNVFLEFYFHPHFWKIL